MPCAYWVRTPEGFNVFNKKINSAHGQASTVNEAGVRKCLGEN